MICLVRLFTCPNRAGLEPTGSFVGKGARAFYNCCTATGKMKMILIDRNGIYIKNSKDSCQVVE